jgi:hypothetical protein
LDFRLRCHHPYSAIKVIASDIAASGAVEYETKHGADAAPQYGYQSPRSVYYVSSEERMHTLCERALSVAQSALVYSDVNFLFAPGKIAFAAVAIALEGKTYGGGLGFMMRKYLRMRFPQKTTDELSEFEHDVVSIIRDIERCPEIDLNKFSSPLQRGSRRTAQNQAAEVRRVFFVAAHFRRHCRASVFTVPPTQAQSGRKRMRMDDEYPSSHLARYKSARVTPNQTPIL